jgi:N-methylhydantoinase A
VRTHYRVLADANPAEIGAIYAELAQVGASALDQAGVEPPARSVEHFMDLRYVGQEFHLQIPVAADEIVQGDLGAIRRRFDETHLRRFDHAAPEEPVELVNLRLTARGARPKITFPKLEGGVAGAQIGTRPIVLDDPSRPVDCPVYRRELLGPGMRLVGPCAIEEFGSTTIVFAGDRVAVAETGEIIVEVARA